MTDSDPFSDDIPSDHEILRSLWRDMQEVKEQVKRTNGRVTSLEKFRWAGAGGLLVIMAIVVPMFLDLVRHA